MSWLVESGAAALLVMAVLFIEAAWLLAKGWSARKVTGLLGPAVFIVIALYAALRGADWIWIALALAASFPLHLMDLRGRLADRT